MISEQKSSKEKKKILSNSISKNPGIDAYLGILLLSIVAFFVFLSIREASHPPMHFGAIENCRTIDDVLMASPNRKHVIRLQGQLCSDNIGSGTWINIYPKEGNRGTTNQVFATLNVYVVSCKWEGDKSILVRVPAGAEIYTKKSHYNGIEISYTN